MELDAATPSVLKEPNRTADNEHSSAPNSLQTNSQNPAIAKRYSRTKLLLGLTGSALYFLFSLGMIALGGSSVLGMLAFNAVSNPYLQLLVFAFVFGTLELVVSFPLSFYSGFVLEHRYQLSNQTFLRWLWEGAKGMFVALPIGIPILLAFYYCLRTFGMSWWLPVGAVLFTVSVVLARVAPVVIFPLFFKFKPLEDESLRKKILTLCEHVGVRVEGIFVFDLSKNTKKANAAFTGIGKSKRIILGDTLVANLTDEEIETVFAHELGHYRLGHVWIMLLVGAISTFAGLYLTALAYNASLKWFGFAAAADLPALPLLGIWMGVYSLLTSPLFNIVSRAHERSADRYAIAVTGNKSAFAAALQKLSRVNLSDTAPHPLVEFLFHSHPSITKRIQAVEAMPP